LEQEKKPSLDWVLLKRVLKLAMPFKRLFILCLVLAVILAPLNTASPWLINQIVDNYVFQSDVQGLLMMCGVFVGVLIVTGLLQYVFIYLTSLLGQSVIKDLRVSVFKHIVQLKLRFFDQTPIGTVTTRTINDIETINTVFSQGSITIIADILSLFVVLIVMFYTSVSLTLICLVTLPLIMIATYIFKQKVKASYQTVRTQISKMNAFLQERITGMRIIQIFNAEQQERGNFKKINREYTRANLDAILYYAVFFPVVEVISAIALGLMVWWGARGVIGGNVTPGELVAFPLYLNLLFRPMRILADKFNTLQMGLVAADRVFAILDDTSKIDNIGTSVKEKFEGKISFQNVRFSYDGENQVIHDLSFDVKPGESLAIVGSTGSGKTTIINILNRFYEISGGKVLIDDLPIDEYELFHLRERLAMVLQDVFLFTGTVMENIALRNDSISREKVIEASKKIGAHPFFENLPNGYDFIVTERGNNLSMGQRQLISFVRALVYDPDILILDEATSSIDTETEGIIQYAIETLIQKRTSIIIAHRLSTIRNADHIMVMEKGRKIEFGGHDELVKIENGKYRSLYEMQFETGIIP
jgi:ATP-binding cassette subfamily B protein